MPANAATPQPTSRRERIETLDVLRGFALMGILVVNIQAMAMIGAAYGNPTAYGDFEGLNRLVWLVTYFFFESKMMSIFSMLFGAGILLMHQRMVQQELPNTGIHFRRMGWLLLFGLAHAHLIWFGDILYSYALCGVCFWFLKGLSPRWLISLGASLILVPVLVALVLDAQLDRNPAMLEQVQQSWQPGPTAIAEELAIYRGSWIEQMQARVTTSLFFEIFLFPTMFFWRVGGLILLGMALFKLKILTGDRSIRFYSWGALVGLALGFSLAAMSIYWMVAHDFAVDYGMFEAGQFNAVGSVAAAFGYICVVALVGKNQGQGWTQPIRRAFAAAGQMALTNYLMQSLIATFLFYGHGLGWIGTVSRTEQLVIVMMICCLQLLVSPVWLHWFRFGPAEWLWRTLTYWKCQPWLRQRR